jgi:DNA-binding GntR family transcriptional regulator
MERRELRTTSVVDALATDLRELIFEGTLKPGERIGEENWSACYRVGRQTLRAALQVLCQQGLVTKEPNRGFFVRRLDEADIADLFRIRRVLELEAVNAIVRGSVVPDRAAAAVKEMSALADDAPWRAVLDADRRFHRALIEAAGSPRLIRAYDTIESEIVLCMVARPQYSRAEHAAEHAELLQLLKAGDRLSLEEAFTEHLRTSQGNVIAAHLNPALVGDSVTVR